MKFTVLTLVLVFILLSFQNSDLFSASANSRFATYKNSVSWKEELFYLHDFGIYLKKYPEMIGYMAFYRKKGEPAKPIGKRLDKARKFLMKTYGIEEKRLVVIDAGVLESSVTILQPVDKNFPPPF